MHVLQFRPGEPSPEGGETVIPLLKAILTGIGILTLGLVLVYLVTCIITWLE